jgi:hypothetical protein
MLERIGALIRRMPAEMPVASTEGIHDFSFFYTADSNERNNAIQNLHFSDEGIVCYVFSTQVPGSAPLFRAWHPTTGAHLYTMNAAERDRATTTLGYVAEGISGYIYGGQQSGAIPLYRAYQPPSDDHFYTADQAEHSRAVQQMGYNEEGVTGYVLAAATGGAVPLYRMSGPQISDSMSTDTGDVSIRGGNHMQTVASMNSAGLISGHTHTWCNVALEGFHGSVLPILLDADGKAVWPSDPDGTKHTYGVDGYLVGTHDRTDFWTNQADPGILAKAKSLNCINYYDPHNMLLHDIPIVLQTAEEIAAAIKAIAG